jgi:hypothetical protein
VRRLCLVVVVAAGCQRPAQTLTPAPQTSVQPRCETRPTSVKLRRLTRLEWQASVQRALGVETTLDVQDDEGLGFSTVSEAQAASSAFTEKLVDASERASAALRLADLSPCPPSDECAPRYLDEVGRRLFRRPLTPAEHQRLLSAYQQLRATEDVDAAHRPLTQALLEAPQFLFRLEAADGGVVDAVSLATRLSFALTGEGPDDALLALAQSGALVTPETLRAEAERLFATSQARRTVGRFHQEWLGVAALTNVSRGEPDGGFQALAPSMQREVAELGAFVTLDDRHLSRLFSGKTTFVDPKLGALYGLDGLEGDGFRRITFEQTQRIGVLTAPGVMAAWAKSTGTSPTLRGRFVRERLLCQKLPTPPPNVSMTLPNLGAVTTRARFTRHVTDPACSGCHQLLDPIGFGLERYDATGAFRLVENGHALDVRGEVTQVDGGFTFEGAEPLGQWLAANPDVRRCVVTQWFRFIMGRAETEGDRCTLDAMAATLDRTDGDVREAVLTLVTSDTFRLAGGAP